MEKRVLSVCFLLIGALALLGCQNTKPMTQENVKSMEAAAPVAEEVKGAFVTLEEDGRLWVLRPGEEKSEKHITLVGAGPNGETIRALSRDTALAFIAQRPGFNVKVEDGRIWVLRPGEKESEKKITLIGAGPLKATIYSLNRATALEYLASKKGFVAKADADERLWIYRADTSMETPEKHITRVGAGPLGATVKALDRETLDAWVKAK